MAECRQQQQSNLLDLLVWQAMGVSIETSMDKHIGNLSCQLFKVGDTKLEYSKEIN